MVEEVIRAKRFEMVDDEGQARVVLGTQDETSGLMLLDSNGQSVAELAVSDDTGSAMLSLYDERGSLRASLDLDADGSPTVGLYDISGEPRISLGIAEGGSPVLDFTGPFGEARMSLVMDGEGNDRATIRVDKDGTPFLEFMDADGRPVQ
jgi:hypothetical protein